jgi:hypothetical protein
MGINIKRRLINLVLDIVIIKLVESLIYLFLVIIE